MKPSHLLLYSFYTLLSHPTTLHAHITSIPLIWPSSISHLKTNSQSPNKHTISHTTKKILGPPSTSPSPPTSNLRISSSSSSSTALQHAISTFYTLQTHYYNATTGLYDTTGWWNSANILTTVVNLALLLPNESAVRREVVKVVENSVLKAPRNNPTVSFVGGGERGRWSGDVGYRKRVDWETFLVRTEYEREGNGYDDDGYGNDLNERHNSKNKDPRWQHESIEGFHQVVIHPQGGTNSKEQDEKNEESTTGVFSEPTWLNNYYDDEAWWTLFHLQAYTLTNNKTYLQTATTIFSDLLSSPATPCSGGIFWSKTSQYVNAITNELYLSIAAKLATRSLSGYERKRYLKIAEKQWRWFEVSGMINELGNINDGLRLEGGGCVNNGGTVWSYNQGVILEGLSELYLATGNITLLNVAVRIAEAGIRKLTDEKGILRDMCEPNSCGADGVQFKGVFLRGLQSLIGVLEVVVAKPRQEEEEEEVLEERQYWESEKVLNRFSNFVNLNAESIWEHDRNEWGGIGVVWGGPLVDVNAGSMGSGLDALIAAAAISAKGSESRT